MGHMNELEKIRKRNHCSRS